MKYESDLEAADRALAYMDAMLSGARIAGNVVFSAREAEEGAR